MICAHCEDGGIVPYALTGNPKPDAAIGTDDLHFAVCLCPAGEKMRSRKNAGKVTDYPLWMAWAAQQRIDPSRVCMLEDAYTPEQLAAAGFREFGASDVSREAALLGAAKTRRTKL